MHGRRRWLLLSLPFLALTAAGLLPRGADPALAHAVLLRSNPAQNARLQTPPTLVQLFFSEPLDRRFSGARVLNAGNANAASHAARFTADPTEMDLDLPATLTPAFYSVAWTSVSAVDSHRLTGSFPFVALNPDGSTPAGTFTASRAALEAGLSPFDTAVHWLLLLGLIGAFAAFALPSLMLLPAAATLAAHDRGEAEWLALRLAGAVAQAAAGVVLAATLTGVLREAWQVGGASAVGGVLDGRTGLAAIGRGLAATAALGIALRLRPRREHTADGRTRLWLWAGAAAGLGALVTLPFTSHAAARAGAGWAAPSDLAHLLAAALWLGCLAQLPLLWRGSACLNERARLALFAGVLGRFSALAALSVGAVALTGLFNASVEIGSLRNFGSTQYGRALLVKLALVAPLFALGLLNAAWLAPRVHREVEGNATAGPRKATRLLIKTIAVEALLGALVIGATAALVYFVPARDAVAGKRAKLQPGASASSIYRNAAPAGDLQVSLTITPNRAGENQFRVLLSGPDADAAVRVQLRFQLPDPQAGPSTLIAEAQGGGLFGATAANLSGAGRWQIGVNVRRAGHDDVNAAFGVETPDAAGIVPVLSTGGRDVWTFPGRGISPNQTLGVALVFAGVALYQTRGRLRRQGSLSGRAAGALAILALVGGGMLFFAVHSHSGQGADAAVTNPVPADERSLRAGGQLYAENCQQCHGLTGHGDGPLAAGLNPKPVDLTVHAGLHPDAQLYDWITNGIAGTAMPAWKDQLSDTQRWDLVNYLRTLSARVIGDGSAPGVAGRR